MGIFTHMCVGTNDLERAVCFYDAALAPLGIRNLGRFGDQGVSYGRDVPELLILRPVNGAPATASNGGTVGLKAQDRRAVKAFHAAGIAHGGTDAGAPGPRNAVPHAYGAYLYDPDHNKLCAYCFAADG